LGWDISGEIVKRGRNVHSFKVGDQVFGMINFIGHGKAYAEYASAPARHLALKPPNISHAEAAASSLAALTAWQAFTKYGKLKKGDSVLIHAAAGGVGHYAVQMAKHLGAHVIGTASGYNKEFIQNLGADEHINYKETAFEEVLSNIDFALETISGDHFARTVKVVKPGGTIINLPSGLTEEDKKKARQKNINATFFMNVYSSGQHMKQIAKLLQKQFIHSHVSKEYQFNQIKEAHEQIESGKTRGKVVLTLN
jgi:NADPH:quinone reductase-like Zn-dependent oxidoreductase